MCVHNTCNGSHYGLAMYIVAMHEISFMYVPEWDYHFSLIKSRIEVLSYVRMSDCQYVLCHA